MKRIATSLACSTSKLITRLLADYNVLERRTLFCDEKLRRYAVEHTTVKAGCEYLKSRITSVRDKCVSTVKALLSVSQEDMCSDRRVAKYDSSHTTILS